MQELISPETIHHISEVAKKAFVATVITFAAYRITQAVRFGVGVVRMARGEREIDEIMSDQDDDFSAHR